MAEWQPGPALVSAPTSAPTPAPKPAPAPAPDPSTAVLLCASGALVEKGLAHGFDVLHFRAPARGFALRFEGRVVAYLNRCLHVPVEMDWNPGDFLDSDKTFILCATHGAAYEPLSGRCAGGPCGRGRLTAIETIERDGQVYWYPSRDTKPTPAATDAAAASRPS
jgi:nitrite reductase/ring-hydroxylating ferredoxin subunit